MNKLFPIACLFALLAWSPSLAAELVLRSQATEHGPLVRLSDVADISAKTKAEVQQLKSISLFPAPAAGTEFFLTVEKLRDLLQSRGLDTSRLSISGSLVVQVGAANRTTSKAEVVKPKTLTEEGIQIAVKNAVQQRLRLSDPTTVWTVDVPLTNYQLQRMASISVDAVVEAHEMQTLRSGRVKFKITDGKLDWMISVELTQIQSVVVAKQAIQRGQLVRAVDVEIRQRHGNLPSGILTQLDQAIGQVAQRNFNPDDVVIQTSLRAPWKVLRGETVNVYIRTGGIVVRSRAIAKQDGALGELITVETLADKQRLDVTVSGHSEVTVHASGGTTGGLATLNRRDTLRK